MDSLIKLSDIDLLDGVQFENLIYRLLNNMGFDVETTKATGDGGIDLIAYNVKRQIITNWNFILFLLLAGNLRQIIPMKSLYQ